MSMMVNLEHAKTSATEVNQVRLKKSFYLSDNVPIIDAATWLARANASAEHALSSYSHVSRYTSGSGYRKNVVEYAKAQYQAACDAFIFSPSIKSKRSVELNNLLSESQSQLKIHLACEVHVASSPWHVASCQTSWLS